MDHQGIQMCHQLQQYVSTIAFLQIAKHTSHKIELEKFVFWGVGWCGVPNGLFLISPSAVLTGVIC